MSLAAAEQGPLPDDVLARITEIAAMVPFRPFDEPFVMPFGRDYRGPAHAGEGAPTRVIADLRTRLAPRRGALTDAREYPCEGADETEHLWIAAIVACHGRPRLSRHSVSRYPLLFRSSCKVLPGGRQRLR